MKMKWVLLTAVFFAITSCGVSIEDINARIKNATKKDKIAAAKFVKQGVAFHRKDKQIKKAIKSYQKAIELYPIAATYYKLANAVTETESFADSLKYYKIAASLDFSKKKLLFYNMACVYSRVGKLVLCEVSLEKAIKSGYRSYTHIYLDKDLSKFRESKNFLPFVINNISLKKIRIRDFRGLSLLQLFKIRNSYLARLGVKFIHSKYLNKFYSQFSWYKPTKRMQDVRLKWQDQVKINNLDFMYRKKIASFLTKVGKMKTKKKVYYLSVQNKASGVNASIYKRSAKIYGQIESKYYQPKFLHRLTKKQVLLESLTTLKGQDKEGIIYKGKCYERFVVANYDSKGLLLMVEKIWPSSEAGYCSEGIYHYKDGKAVFFYRWSTGGDSAYYYLLYDKEKLVEVSRFDQHPAFYRMQDGSCFRLSSLVGFNFFDLATYPSFGGGEAIERYPFANISHFKKMNKSGIYERPARSDSFNIYMD